LPEDSAPKQAEMKRRYYSSRTRPQELTLQGLYLKLQHLYLLFRDKDYFSDRAGITKFSVPDQIKHKAVLDLSFQPFLVTKWTQPNITEDHIFDTIEFLYDYVSLPTEMANFDPEVAWEKGRAEFREEANAFLADYKSGYELTNAGTILALGTDGLQEILHADLIPYDELNVDSKVRHAIAKWRNRRLTLADKKEAIRELADVFEWLKKTKRLGSVLSRKDESAIFEIANNFAIRHHDPKQKANYDPDIWYSWMFHFYLATYHAAIRLLMRREGTSRGPGTSPNRSSSTAP
jgi:hypothetical protein